jgi:CDP-glucose 4,6-dehydratase
VKPIINSYRNKTVLVTGHTGFKGTWLCHWLDMMGARVVGIAVDIPTEPANFNVSGVAGMIKDHRLDIRNTQALAKLVKETDPDFVFHLAAQPLVRYSHAHPLETMTTNAIGTAAVLESLKALDKTVTAIMVTSDKAYDNVEWPWGYRETDFLGGKDIYSASKGMAELAIKGYLHTYFNNAGNVRLGIVRAGNVIGGGDWAPDRIVPDAMRAWSRNEDVKIRSSGATRPWQHVLEPLGGYLHLGAVLADSPALHGEAFNFGPPADQDFTVRDLLEEMQKHWENISWKDMSGGENKIHEAGLLKLNCDKALALLGWHSVLDFAITVEMTVKWYKTFYGNPKAGMRNLTREQISQYLTLAGEQGFRWAHD